MRTARSFPPARNLAGGFRSVTLLLVNRREFPQITWHSRTPVLYSHTSGRRLVMEIPWRTMIWQQFGAAIDTLDDMLLACPDVLWRERLWDNPSAPPELAEFWYRVYHALFWLDLYLTGAEEGFSPPAPFTLIEQDENGPLPE